MDVDAAQLDYYSSIFFIVHLRVQTSGNRALRALSSWTFLQRCTRAAQVGRVKRQFLAVLLSCLAAGCESDRITSHTGYEYDKPLLSPGAQFAALPPAVQNAVRAETGSASIAKVVKDTSLGRIVYHIYFQNSDLFPPLNVAPDGSLLDRDLVVAMGAPIDSSNVVVGGAVSGITLNDLPSPVVKVVQHRAPDAQIDSIIRQVKGNQATYLITFKDRLHGPLEVASDGTILSEGAK